MKKATILKHVINETGKIMSKQTKTELETTLARLEKEKAGAEERVKGLERILKDARKDLSIWNAGTHETKDKPGTLGHLDYQRLMKNADDVDRLEKMIKSANLMQRPLDYAGNLKSAVTSLQEQLLTTSFVVSKYESSIRDVEDQLKNFPQEDSTPKAEM